MNKTKCKHCCQEIVFEKEVWLDSGPIIRSICLSSPTLLHEPEEVEEEVKENVT